MLPRPRPRPAPDVVRDRLRALASGSATPDAWTREPPHPASLADDLLSGPDAPRRRAAPLLPTWVRPVAVAVVATAVAAWIVLRVVVGGPPTPVELVPGTPLPTLTGLSASPSPTLTQPVDVVVHVLGEVRHPGLVTLPAGSRVADAIAAAGGLRPGGSAGGLNLARVLVDGEQVDVSRDAVAAPATGPGATSTGPIDLNTASVEDLDALPGVGPVLAGRIVDWRTQHGRFASVDQLREVSGIGARTFERLAPLVRV